jgi:hypothetical protein
MKLARKFVWFAIAVGALSVATLESASARAKHHTARRVHCVDQPYQFSWDFLLPGHPAPQPNGCSPPAYQYNRYIGQDPDANIRFQLRRDPATGYAPL